LKKYLKYYLEYILANAFDVKDAKYSNVFVFLNIKYTIIVSVSFRTLLKIFNSLCIVCSIEIYETSVAFRSKYPPEVTRRFTDRLQSINWNSKLYFAVHDCWK